MMTAFSLILYTTFIRNLQEEFDAALYNYAIDVSESVQVNLFGDVQFGAKVLRQNLKVLPFALGRSYFQLGTLDGKVLITSENLVDAVLPISPDELTQVEKQGYTFKTIRRKREQLRLVNYLLKNRSGTRLVIHIAVPMTFLENEERRMQMLIVVLLPFTLLIAMVVGWLVASRALRSLRIMISKASSLRAANLSERLPVPSSDDELEDLALTLNDLLDRLEKAFRSQERFIADASHELKTPLAIVRGELDILLSKNRSIDEVRAALREVSGELDHLTKLVEDLLVLARVDAGAGSLVISNVRLDDVLVDVVSSLEKFAALKNIKIRLDMHDISTAEAKGDAGLLHSMVRNLLENAIKFSPDHEVVRLELFESEGHFRIAVTDRGLGIAKEDMEKIFNRFFRATNHNTKGFGLGLGIARRIAQAHQGSVEVESSADAGTVFTAVIRK